jgi:predicted transport protein
MHLLIKKSELHDPSNKVRDIGGPRHVSGLTEVIIKEQDEIHYVLPFIQRSYNKNLTW